MGGHREMVQLSVLIVHQEKHAPSEGREHIICSRFSVKKAS